MTCILTLTNVDGILRPLFSSGNLLIFGAFFSSEQGLYEENEVTLRTKRLDVQDERRFLRVTGSFTTASVYASSSSKGETLTRKTRALTIADVRW